MRVPLLLTATLCAGAATTTHAQSSTAPNQPSAAVAKVETLKQPPLPFKPAETTVVQASKQYEGGRLRTWLLGQNYRTEWQQPIRVPVLNLGTEQGGLQPLRQGGGKQTKSLRLRASSGREFVLRSIEKNTEMVLSEELRNTLAAKVVQDQVSAAHPYAALAVPTLAEAAGVGHTNPRLVYVPDDAQLGDFRGLFANTLAILEERDPQVPSSFTGQALEKNYSTDKALELLRKDLRNRLDHKELVRARLFDMVLADFDRHEDQWRWMAYTQPGGGLLLRALPRDRDQAFFVNQGVLPNLASRNWAVPAVQGFDGNLRDVNTFMFSGRYFDRSFLTEPAREEWLEVARDMQARLTDEVLEKAIRQLPDTVYRISGPDIVAKLKTNRDALPTYAEQYYRFLAREVDITGSDQPDYFEVVRQDDAHTRVRVYPLEAGRPVGQPLYERTFLTGETREIRLYGYGGRDMMEVSGAANDGITVRLIGGPDEDVLVDRSHVAGARHLTRVYDTPTGNQLQLGSEARNLTSNDSTVNKHDRQAFRYTYVGPTLPWSYNPDDGLFVGLGLEIRKPGFRKEPWATIHRLEANVALATGAYSFRYSGEFNRLLGQYDLVTRADVQAPNYVRNFFGLGNDTEFNQNLGIRYYRLRFSNLALQALLRRRWGLRHQFYAGPLYQRVEVAHSPGRFIEVVRDDRMPMETRFDNKNYAGLKAGYTYDSRDVAWWPTRGLFWHTDYLLLRGLNDVARPLSQISSEAAAYWTPKGLSKLTFAGRVGSTVNFSNYEFFQAATLGGLSNLRGYRRTRFAGTSSFYHNVEFRAQVGTFNTILVSGKFGLLGFHDGGRVWVKNEDSDTWHTGYGAGLWFEPFRRVVVVGTYCISREEKLPLIRMGFQF